MRIFTVGAFLAVLLSAQAPSPLPSGPLVFGGLAGEFRADGTYSFGGPGWPTFTGSWKADGGEITLQMAKPLAGCSTPARYRFAVTGTRLAFDLVEDACATRRLLLDRSTWRPAGEKPVVPVRNFTLTAAPGLKPLPVAAGARGAWPSFRGQDATGIADGQNLPDTWDVKTGDQVLWRTPIPGLAHSSPIVWGDRVFVTTAVSSRGNATFKPGLYGDGDASDDRSSQRWMLYALDRTTGRVVWERTAAEGVPGNKRHIKSTYASATPATDGRTVVAWFGSQGVHAYDVNGTFRWKVEFGRVDMGAYDVPSVEWGPASSPVIWNNLVIVQCDTQADSFLLALDLATGKTVWKTEREELPSWGTPTVVTTPAGPELVTNASNFVRGYDPKTGKERWRLGRSSKITAPTPFAAEGLMVIASGRAPERPVFVVRPGASGDITPADGAASSAGVVWSKTGRGSYMPTPIAYGGILYVLGNAGIFDAYDLKTGEEIYRQRLEKPGSGFSASPVIADGRIYLSSEDGDVLVIAAGREFRQLASNHIGELLMATPALSNGTMFIRSAQSVIAIGRR